MACVLRVFVTKPALLPTHCRAVRVAPAFEGGPPGVSGQFTADGSERLTALTSTREGQRIAIVVGSLIATAPVVMTAITGGMAMLTLGPDQAEKYAQALANTIAGDYPGEVRHGVRTFGRSKA